MKKLILLAMLCCSQALIGCDSGDVAAGAIGVGVGVGIGSHFRHHRHHRYYHGRRWNVFSAVDAVAVDTDAQNFANKYHISVDAAKKMQTAFLAVSEQGVSAFSSLGLGNVDLKSIAKRNL